MEKFQKTNHTGNCEWAVMRDDYSILMSDGTVLRPVKRKRPKREAA